MPNAVVTACSQARCPYPAVHRGRCVLHKRTTNQRGYGIGHQQARTRLSATLPSYCWYGCGTWLTSGDSWVAAHVRDGDPSSPRVVSCVTCNARVRGNRPVANVRRCGPRLTFAPMFSHPRNDSRHG